MKISENIITLNNITYLAKNRTNTKPKTNTLETSTSAPKSLEKPSAQLLRNYFCPQNQVNFRGAPWKLNVWECGVSNYGSISAQDAIRIFEKLKLGNYLDIGDDRISYYSNKAIRDANLGFLDRITSKEEQQKFITYYKQLTGFPNLAETSRRIKKEFIQAITTSSRELNGNSFSTKYDIVTAGYDGVCSVGRGKAFPGSDIDKAYVVLKGGSSWEAEELVNRFKGKLWENTDQRILSYNHDEAAFPQVYTKEQVQELVQAADNFVFPTARTLSHMPIFSPGSIATRFVSKAYIKNQTDYFLDLQKNYNPNYVEAAEFYIDLCQNFPRKYNDLIDLNNPSRENIKNLGFVLEAIREGEVLKGNRYDLGLSDSLTYKLTNLSQLKALKQRGDAKPKRLSRNILPSLFNSWDTDKQFRFIKTLIHGSCANNTNFTTEFAEYFSKSGNDPFEPLIKALLG